MPMLTISAYFTTKVVCGLGPESRQRARRLTRFLLHDATLNSKAVDKLLLQRNLAEQPISRYDT